MELKDIFSKWKLNHNLFAALIDMPKGTFNHKMNPREAGTFNEDDHTQIKKNLKAMIKDIESYTNTYTVPDEDLTGPVDEVMYYNGKPVN